MADVTKLQAGDGVDDVTDGVVLALGAAKFTEKRKARRVDLAERDIWHCSNDSCLLLMSVSLTYATNRG